MQEELKKISDYWKDAYSNHVKEYRPFEITKDFKRFASMFAIGNSYLYIVNLFNFQIEYISDSVELFIDKDKENIQLQDLLKTVLPEEIENINLKSRVINDFYTSFLEREKVLDYKNMFSYRMKDAQGHIRTMLYQAMPLSVLESGTPEHVFCIQTDVTHLKVTSNMAVSFLNLDGGKSYYNVDVSKGKFHPELCENGKNDLAELFSEREMQIVMSLSRGKNAEQIADELNLSHHTIKTHRRNILQKSGCANTTELVAKCLSNGLISPNLN
ncbi:response regulator transcription factor [Christiangramia sp. SM2212]|uniref:LuxR C-terminal-related transcriptional regulator n=1 Tax=Christiangramia sediminicola TaxID=3073267 RepID=A0ABU1ERZ3_9FLAO|nr:LuxR C-terminal-related transcriptional regulator [Christiangramia sp. SM2212]MDR5591175.1 LuxR C-terminal-related transcriptional regulator [Christiangramia sp. SM2212]